MPRTVVDPRQQRTDLAFAGALSVLFLGVLFVYGPADLEQYHHSHPAVRLFHRALLEGRYLFWTDAFGLGTPLPLGENLAFHPLLLLGQWVPLRWVLSLFWLAHLSAGGYYLLRLCRLTEIDSTVARVVVLGFIASPVTANYVYTDDWPSVFLGWTTLPILVFYSHRLATARGRRAWRSASLLVLLLAFVVWNGHLGHLVSLWTALVVFAMLLSRGSPKIVARFAGVALAVALVAGERLFTVLHEALRFPAGLERLAYGAFPMSAWVQQLYRPLGKAVLEPLLTGEPGAAVDAYLTTMAYVRLPFLGLVFFAAAVWGTVSCLRAAAVADAARLRWASALTFCLVLVASVLPESLFFRVPSAVWLFRDPAALFGLMVAGAALSDWRRRSPGTRRLVGGAMALQLVQIVVVVLPAVLLVHSQRQENVRFYSGESRGEFASWVAGQIGDSRNRTFLSPKVGAMLLSERVPLADLGLLGTGDLEPLGLLPVNGYFKNVSMDELYPSLSRHHGLIGSHAAIVRDRALFDLLAIDYLLTLDSERELDLSGFAPVGAGFPLAEGVSLVLLRNPDAWPLANHYATAAAELKLGARSGPESLSESLFPNCPAPGLLCRDLAPLAAMRLPTEVRYSGRDARILLSIDPAGEERLVVLAQLFRPEWQARSGSGGELPTHQVGGALLGVSVPPGVSQVRLLYRPSARLGLLFLGGLALLGCLGVLALTTRQARHSATGDAGRRVGRD